MIDRRTFGFGVLAGGVLLAAGSIPVLWVLVDEDRVIEAACAACFPGLPVPIAELGVGPAVRAYLAGVPPEVALQARGVWRALDGAAVPFTGSRFVNLAPSDAAAFLDGLASSTLLPDRLIANAVKQMCAVAVFQHPATWVHLGYDGPTVGLR